MQLVLYPDLRCWAGRTRVVIYPRAPRSEWYGEANFRDNGGEIVAMDPARYIASVRPLVMDEESEENIEILAQHMQRGATLDPLVIFNGGREDGRHRAHAAIILGIAEVPVILFGDQIARFADCPRITVEDEVEPDGLSF